MRLYLETNSLRLQASKRSFIILFSSLLFRLSQLVTFGIFESPLSSVVVVIVTVLLYLIVLAYRLYCNKEISMSYKDRIFTMRKGVGQAN